MYIKGFRSLHSKKTCEEDFEQVRREKGKELVVNKKPQMKQGV